MQCFLCMTYMIYICTAHPGINRGNTQHEKRSIFRDVIESLRIRTQLPEDYNQNEENNLAQAYERYGFENDPPHLPSDADFIPRRNDRIEMPSLKYRFPKSLLNDSHDDVIDNSKEEIVLYIDTTRKPKPSSQNPKKQKRPRPTTNKNKTNNRDDEVVEETETEKPEEYNMPWTNTMAGQSQIGNRDSQMVVKPTVIVNIRGSVHHRESDIKIEGRTNNDTLPEIPQNIFNIKQEINLERPIGRMGSNGSQKKEQNVVKQDVKVLPEKDKGKEEEDMMMCETATWNPEKNTREERKYNKILQIMFSMQN